MQNHCITHITRAYSPLFCDVLWFVQGPVCFYICDLKSLKYSKRTKVRDLAFHSDPVQRKVLFHSSQTFPEIFGRHNRSASSRFFCLFLGRVTFRLEHTFIVTQSFECWIYMTDCRVRHLLVKAFSFPLGHLPSAKMSKIEYSNLLFEISKKLDENELPRLIFMCRQEYPTTVFLQ